MAVSSITSSLGNNNAASASVLIPSSSNILRKPSTRCAVVRPMIDIKRETVDDINGANNIRHLLPNLDLTTA